MTPSDSKYLNLGSKESQAFTGQEAKVQEYFLGAKKSLNSESPSMTDDNAVVALSKLNALSDKSQAYAPSGGCAPSEDYYVYDLRDCPSNYEVFNNNTHTISYNYGAKTCIQVQQMYKSNFQ